MKNLRIIIIDTLNCALAGGDENSSTDMGAVLKYAELIRQTTGATVMIVHHTGKNPDLGARGHSSFKGRLDTELSLKLLKNKVLCLKATKQRNFAIDEKIHFRLKKVELGKNIYGKTITSCVVEAAGHFDIIEEMPKLAKGAAKALDVFKELVKTSTTPVALDEWRLAYRSAFPEKPKQTVSSAFIRAVDALSASGYIKKGDANTWVLAQK